MIAGGLDRGNEFDELVPDITGLKKMVILGHLPNVSNGQQIRLV